MPDPSFDPPIESSAARYEAQRERIRKAGCTVGEPHACPLANEGMVTHAPDPSSEPPFDSRDDTVTPRFPVHCPHGRHVGWALRNEPTTTTDTRFCAACPECRELNDDA